MNLLITGGSGFAGRYLIEYFTKLGNKVTATYRRSPPRLFSDNIEYVRQELSAPIMINGQFDAIIHTACARPSEHCRTMEYIRDNIDSSRRIVEFAKRNEIRTIFYFSTRSIYGRISVPEVFEDTERIDPDIYGQTKFIAELVFQDSDDINTIGVRLPGIIGPGAHDIWLTEITESIKKGDRLEISDFETKNLVCISDIARFANKLIKESASGTEFKYKVVNLACREAINNIEIVNMVKKRFNSSSEIVVKGRNPNLFLLNSDKAVEMGFESSTPRDIINGYLDYCCAQEQ